MVMLGGHFSWPVLHLLILEHQFLRQAEHLVMLQCDSCYCVFGKVLDISCVATPNIMRVVVPFFVLHSTSCFFNVLDVSCVRTIKHESGISFATFCIPRLLKHECRSSLVLHPRNFPTQWQAQHW